MFSVFNICIHVLFFFVQNVVEGVVHREGAELLAVRQVEEEDFNGAVLGAQVEEPQEAGLEAGGPAVDLEVVAVVVVEVVEVDLAVVAVVEVGVSEVHSSAASKNLFLYCNSSALYFSFPISLDIEKHKKNLQFYNRLHLSTRYGFNDFTSVVTILTRFTRSCSRDIICRSTVSPVPEMRETLSLTWSNSVAAAEASSNVCSIRFV
jgi:hypothetical protein